MLASPALGTAYRSRAVLEERRGGGGKGVWDPKIAQINISFCEFYFFPL